ncbi:agmatine deiminase family protein [Dellaglioa sp. L3N]
MKKNVISWIGIVVTCVIILGGLMMWFTTKQQKVKMNKGGVIFTALPLKSNHYYRPLYPELVQFSNQFANQAKGQDSVRTLTKDSKVSKRINTDYDDIWLRDVAPVVTNKMVKFRYQPSYLPKKDAKYLDKMFNRFLDKNKIETHSSKLIVDGGNVVWNKKDSVVMTNRVFEDNNQLTKKEVIQMLKIQLEVKKVIIIPAEEEDPLAHADGMIKFISPKKMFISDFQKDTVFQAKVRKVILKEMPDAEFVELKSAYTEKGQYDKKIYSAKGLYINMLETANSIYVPQFGLKQDHEMLKFIRKNVDKPVIPVKVGDISTMGGALNCLTWYYPPVK